MSAMPRKRRLAVKASSVAMGQFRKQRAAFVIRRGRGQYGTSLLDRGLFRDMCTARGTPIPKPGDLPLGDSRIFKVASGVSELMRSRKPECPYDKSRVRHHRIA